jgi:hypothetical protein
LLFLTCCITIALQVLTTGFSAKILKQIAKQNKTKPPHFSDQTFELFKTLDPFNQEMPTENRKSCAETQCLDTHLFDNIKAKRRGEDINNPNLIDRLCFITSKLEGAGKNKEKHPIVAAPKCEIFCSKTFRLVKALFDSELTKNMDLSVPNKDFSNIIIFEIAWQILQVISV